jgi:hypothetical protein
MGHRYSGAEVRALARHRLQLWTSFLPSPKRGRAVKARRRAATEGAAIYRTGERVDRDGTVNDKGLSCACDNPKRN